VESARFWLISAILVSSADDLINIAIEELIHHTFELPGFRTLLDEAQQGTKLGALIRSPSLLAAF